MSDTTNNLRALYPFLYSAEALQTADEHLISSIREKAQCSIDTKQRFFADNDQALVAFARALAQLFSRKSRVFCMGNGGSSCDAAHFAVEFQHPVTAGRTALPAINLTADTAMLSAVSNDVGIEQVFARQIEALAQTGDGLIGFSTSGNSLNLMYAYKKAKSLGLTTFGLCGGDGGAMAASGLVDYRLVVDTTSIHRVQEVHVAAYHIIWDLVHTLLASQRGRCGASDEVH